MKPYPRAIARVLFVMLLWLTVGAVVNVLVAWIAVCLPKPQRVPAPPVTIECQLWPILVPPDWPSNGHGVRNVYPAWESLVVWGMHPAPSSQSAPATLYIVSEFRAGAPFRSLRTWDIGAQRGFRAGKDGWAWDVPLPWGGWINLPLAPLWPGFALNTIVFAIGGFSLWQAVGWVRQRGRADRDECAACGYSRKALDNAAVCPECGRAVPVHPTR